MRYYLLILLLFTILLSSGTPVYAAKKRVKAPVAKSVGISFSKAKLSRPTNSVVVTFLNVNKAKKINYTLSYRANNVPQGVIGSVTNNGQTTDSRDLYFGTCSHGVCTPHRTIRNAVLTVTTTLTNGTVNVKRYTIKI